MNQLFRIITHSKIFYFSTLEKIYNLIPLYVFYSKQNNSTFHQVSAIIWYCSYGKLC